MADKEKKFMNMERKALKLLSEKKISPEIVESEKKSKYYEV